MGYESDADLLRAARAGEPGSLELLLSRHLAGMRAVAISVLGYGPDAEDAVQDAVLVAMRRLDEVRDPDAVGGWLRAVVRNGCRMRLRRVRAVPVADPEVLLPACADLGPQESLDRASTRDWVWHALGELSEPVRLVTLLRHFSGVSSYEQIAALCGIPVGTVRSRLSQGRDKLAAALRNTAERAHADAAAQADTRHREAQATLAAAARGEFSRLVHDQWWPDATMLGPGGERGGRELAIWGMDKDLTEGVRQRLLRVTASRDLVIWEAELVSPPGDPTHCPPAVVWLQRLHEGRVARLRLFHPEPAAWGQVAEKNPLR